MSEPELRLDPAIRLWVFLPIVAITFLVGIVRHYVSILLTSAKKVELSQVRDSQILLRSRQALMKPTLIVEWNNGPIRPSFSLDVIAIFTPFIE